MRVFTNCGEDSIEFKRDYFDLERDYGEIEDKLCGFRAGMCIIQVYDSLWHY